MDATTLAGLVLPGLATTVGGLGVLAFPHPGERVVAGLLGFTGGIMLAASVFSLLVPSLELGSLVEIVVGFVLGTAVISSSESSPSNDGIAPRPLRTVASTVAASGRRSSRFGPTEPELPAAARV